MNKFTPEEIESIVQAMTQKIPTEEEKAKIPVRPPGSYKKMAKVAFSPVIGEKSPPLMELTEKEKKDFEGLTVKIEVVYGKTTITLKEIASLKKNSLLLLEDLCDDLVDIYANGKKIGRGEVVAVDGQFGVKIIDFTKN